MNISEFVLDASVTLSWFFEDESTEYTESILNALENGKAFVPCIWPLEVGNALLVAERRRRLKRTRIFKILNALQQLPIHVEMDRPERVWGQIFSLAREHQLSTYDAAYLDLAIRLDLPIATQDRGLILAATLSSVQVVGVDV